MSEERLDTQRQVAARIRRERERLGLSQQELARQTSLPAAQTVSAIENGDRAVKVAELVRIADVLHLTVNDLLVGPPERPFVLWRERPADENRRLEIEARMLELCRNYRLVEEWVGLPTVPSLPTAAIRPPAEDFAFVSRFAEDTRMRLGLGIRPASSLAAILEEEAGVKVFLERNLPGSAACFRDDASAVILVNASEAPGRRNYNIAHELFHLLTWEVLLPARIVRDEKEWRAAERLANAFAAALLLPSETLLARVQEQSQHGNLGPADWAEIAQEYGVSVDVLVWRLVNLGQLGREKAQAIIADRASRRIATLGLRPCPEPELLPERFLRLLLLAYTRGRVSAARIAEMTGQSLVEVRRQLANLDDEGGEFGEATAATA